MKKFLRLTAALMAVFAMTSFIACSSDDDDDDDVAVTSVEITADATEVEAGKTITLKATVTPDNATDKTVTWTSSDEKIATVKDGTVTGVAEGKATITAKAGDKTATKEITVKAASSSGDSGSTGGSGSGDSGSTGGSGSGDSGSTGGSGSGDSGSTGGTGEYKVVYNGEPIDEGTYTLEEAKALANKYGLAETTDYTIDEANKKIVLTDSGMAKVEAAMGGSGGGSGETPVAGEYKVVYAGETVMEGLTLEAATAMATEIGLVEPTDYTINNETKIITLTDSGMAKVEAAESGSGAGGETSTTVTAVVYNLAALTNEDYVTLGSVIDGKAQQYSDSKGTLKNALKINVLNPAVTLSNGLIAFNTSANQILVRTTSAEVLTPAGAINYGGQSVGDKNNIGAVPENVGDTVALSETVKVSRYLAIPVTGGDAASQFKVSVTYKPTNTKGIQIVLVDQNNVMLAKDDANATAEEKTFVSPAITKGEVTEVRVYLFRTGDATSGGADVSEISIAPVTE